jgi:hypothetical protein
MEDLKQTEIEKLRQIISRTDKSGNEKLLLLMDFIYTREADVRLSLQINWDDVYEEANHRSPTAFDEYVKSICNAL